MSENQILFNTEKRISVWWISTAIFSLWWRHDRNENQDSRVIHLWIWVDFISISCINYSWVEMLFLIHEWLVNYQSLQSTQLLLSGKTSLFPGYCGSVWIEQLIIGSHGDRWERKEKQNMFLNSCVPLFSMLFFPVQLNRCNMVYTRTCICLWLKSSKCCTVLSRPWIVSCQPTLVLHL